MNTIVAERVLSTSQVLQIVRGDLTEETTEAVVNAANAHLMHGAGVAGAILARGGKVIREESQAWIREHGLVHHMQPAWTSGGLLKAKYVIHAVGPIWGEGDEDSKLADAVGGSLRVAEDLGLSSISLPAISTGIYGFPRDRAAQVMLAAIQEHLARSQSKIKLVRVVLVDQPSLDAFMSVWERWA